MNAEQYFDLLAESFNWEGSAAAEIFEEEVREETARLLAVEDPTAKARVRLWDRFSDLVDSALDHALTFEKVYNYLGLVAGTDGVHAKRVEDYWIKGGFGSSLSEFEDLLQEAELGDDTAADKAFEFELYVWWGLQPAYYASARKHMARLLGELLPLNVSENSISAAVQALEWGPGRFGAALEASLNGHSIELFFDPLNGRARPSLLVDGVFSTDYPDQWDQVGAVFPRDFWPDPIWRGKSWDGKPRYAPAALVKAIEDYQRMLDVCED